ncbi:magnesium-transporting ATPase [Tersicoccus solisilvae]|uniref:Magnesium-transporting ATPase n=1 Tax=Tersicoccus solisilvae TaxID=1882339 RepID=A0ABQ1P170_9MICC|nr:cation-transporting P-type ATPase [Tersicoccus solisilvae]GGC89142.1 magnesium-transporting ATPase [Tersicoccus solisilvae]
MLSELGSGRAGLSQREADRRLVVYGPNELVRRGGRTWPRQVLRQLTQPLALLLWIAAALSAVTGAGASAVTIVVIVLLNAGFAFIQERHAERAVEALKAYLPPSVRVLRDGVETLLDARVLVPGDVIVVGEGDRVSADARLLEGAVEMDLSTLTGESVPVLRAPRADSAPDGGTDAVDAIFSGTVCTGGEARAAVTATGMHTELGRIAALTERVGHDSSPLERQVGHATRVIGIVSVLVAASFIPVGMFLASLSVGDTLNFAIGLLVANVPEGLLPTISLALAAGVRGLAREGALVKRMSAVETLGSTSVICTDKTGTLTLNRMRAVALWTPARGPVDRIEPATVARLGNDRFRLARALTACNNAHLDVDGRESGDPTEVALLRAAVALGGSDGTIERLAQFPFDATLRRMSTVDRVGDEVRVHAKGAPEEIVPLCDRRADAEGADVVLTARDRDSILGVLDAWAVQGLRVLAVAERRVTGTPGDPLTRHEAESGLVLLGMVALQDPPRPEVADAVRHCHAAGIRLIIMTGDHGMTARGIATRIGIGGPGSRVINGADLDHLSEAELDAILASEEEVIFARTSPEAKLRVADALRALGYVVAMTGDGVNDAPALRRADIGIAMGRSGTDVAREAAAMVLVDDDFASIVSAVRSGRRVYDNIRKFIVYVFAHATPEVVPFLLYAVAGGAVPLPLTVMQILAIDLGTETLPALALGREPEEPRIMERPPRAPTQHIIDAPMLVRAWGLLGGISAALVTAAFLITLLEGGWSWGSDTSEGPLHAVTTQATTITFLAIVACQIGTAFAARTQDASLAQIGFGTNRLLLGSIVVELVFSALIVYLPPAQLVFGTAAPEPWQLLMLLPFPVIVWGADEIVRCLRRRRRGT